MVNASNMSETKTSLIVRGSLSCHVMLQRLLALRAFILGSFVVYIVFFNSPETAIVGIGLILFCSIVFSIISWPLSKKSQCPASTFIAGQLLWDSLVIMLFVWLAGRSTNPFIYYQLLVIAVSATVLPERIAWLFSGIGVLFYSALLYFDIGLHMGHLDSSFKSHLLGMWINFTGSALLIAFFISRLSSALAYQEEALRLAREENLKNEQLLGLGTLAATTVHSFGTPLSTIRMAVSELDELNTSAESRECTSVIIAQIERCKATMERLKALTTKQAIKDQKISVHELYKELTEYLYLINVQPMPAISLPPELGAYILPGGMLLEHAVINLIDNAVEAAKDRVEISFVHVPQSHKIRIHILDDGGGIDSSTKMPSNSSRQGLGIGLLLVNSTIERLGGSVKYQNPQQPEDLTEIIIELPCSRAC